jgi:hypothetical protein
MFLAKFANISLFTLVFFKKKSYISDRHKEVKFLNRPKGVVGFRPSGAVDKDTATRIKEHCSTS